MKTATDWLNQVGEAVMKSAFSGAQPPGIETERVIEAIQKDARIATLREAAEIAESLANVPGSQIDIAGRRIRYAILSKVKELEP